MKKTNAPKGKKPPPSADMLREYRFDYRKGKPNRFSARMNANELLVVIDPDVARVFTTPELVNRALRALITAMPKQGPRRA